MLAAAHPVPKVYGAVEAAVEDAAAIHEAVP